MAGEEAIVNVSGVVDKFIPELLEKAGPLITIFKAVGIVLIIYIAYLLYRAITKIKDRRRWKRIEMKVLEIDEKLDKILGKKEKSSDEKKEKHNKRRKRKK
jgi:hypothetical protein